MNIGENPISSRFNIETTEGRPVIVQRTLDFFRFVSTTVQKIFPLGSTKALSENVREIVTVRCTLLEFITSAR